MCSPEPGRRPSHSQFVRESTLMCHVQEGRDPIADFIAAAERYVALIDDVVAGQPAQPVEPDEPTTRPDWDEPELITNMAVVLTNLYGAALALPLVDVSEFEYPFEKLPPGRYGEIQHGTQVIAREVG